LPKGEVFYLPLEKGGRRDFIKLFQRAKILLKIKKGERSWLKQ
jgi:hypothetical protein